MENITTLVVRGRPRGRPRGSHGRCLTGQGDRRARAMSRARVASPVKQEEVCCAATTLAPVTPVLNTLKQAGCAQSFPSVKRACTSDGDDPCNLSVDSVHGKNAPQSVKASTDYIPSDVVLKSTSAVRSRRGRPRISIKRCTRETAQRKRREQNRKRCEHPPYDATTDSIADVK